jgi:methionine aminopeptidase
MWEFANPSRQSWKMWVCYSKNTEAHGYGVVRELVGHGLEPKNARRS